MSNTDAATRVIPFEDARTKRETLRTDGMRLVFTNGCFDILHVGHIRYLEQARRLGDALWIGINSDASVRTLKGPGRPINPETARAEVLAALRCVDYVTIFDDPRATRLIRELAPDLYVKGGDYTPDTLDPDEKAALHEAGTEIEILPFVEGYSTTQTLSRINPGT